MPTKENKEGKEEKEKKENNESNNENEELNFRNEAIRTIRGLAEENIRLKQNYGRNRITASDIRARNSKSSSSIKGLGTLGNPLGSVGKPKAPYKGSGGLDLSSLA
jgi:hypothetical protein